MALAVIATGALHAALPAELRSLPPELLGDSRWGYLIVVVVLLTILIAGDPGRIDRDVPWLRVLTIALVALISLDNAAVTVRLVHAIVHTLPFTENPEQLLVGGAALWLSCVLAFALWYWEVDRGGAVARVQRRESSPAFVFPEMDYPQYVGPDWCPKFVDYLHLSFSTATALSPTDVSAVRSWAKLTMMLEEAISLVVAVLVIARAVNLLQ